MKMSRKPKPVQLQVAEGDPSRRGVHKLDEMQARLPNAQRGLPDPPKRLSRLAKKQWNIWKQDLELMDLDYRADAVALEGACVSYAGAVEADAVLRRFRRRETREEVLDKATGEVLAIRLRNHPAVARQQAFWKLTQSFLTELGLTIASRQRISVDVTAATGDDVDIEALLTRPREAKVPEPEIPN
jgi:P27 family predicted phage terminase small subunit